MRDHLHDEIDKAERFVERAREIVARVREKKITAAMKAASEYGAEHAAGSHPRDDITLGLQLIAGEVGKQLASLTTEAVQTMGEMGAKRRERGGK